MVGLHNWCFHDLTNIFTQKLSFGTLSDSIYLHDIWVFHLQYQSVTGGNPWNTMKTSITVILYPAATSNMNIDIIWNSIKIKSIQSQQNHVLSCPLFYGNSCVALPFPHPHTVFPFPFSQPPKPNNLPERQETDLLAHLPILLMGVQHQQIHEGGLTMMHCTQKADVTSGWSFFNKR